MNYNELVNRKKLSQLTKNAQSGTLFVFLLVFVFYLITPEKNIHSTIWLLVTILVLVFRLRTNSWIGKQINTNFNITSLERYYNIASIITSSCLGYFALFIVDNHENIDMDKHDDYISAIYILLICIIPGSIVIQGVKIKSFLYFITPLTVCLIISGFVGNTTTNDENSLYITLIFLLPLLGAIILAKRQDRLYTKLFLNEIKLEESNKQLENIASKDPLTDLFNRRFYDEYLSTEWERNQRNNSVISMMLIDIDKFKEFNDFYGHAKGDNCILRISSIIKASLKRPGDKAFRYGGDEFLVLLPETDEKGTLEVGERIKKIVEELNIPHEASNISMFITVSIGIACVKPNQNETADSLFNKADNQLYNAKKQGRNAIASISHENFLKPQ